MKRRVQLFIVLGILTVVFGTIYITTQQVLRSSANDPQIQLAEDTAAALNASKSPADLVHGSIDPGKSLAPFIIIYDLQGTVVAANAQLNNAAPVIPIGVLEAAKGRAYHAVTWQPAPRVRIASVSVAAKTYYVVSGRSLAPIEQREHNVLLLTMIGWAASVAVLLAGVLLQAFVRSRPSKKS